jgi:hypothetical protein
MTNDSCSKGFWLPEAKVGGELCENLPPIAHHNIGTPVIGMGIFFIL